MIKMANRAALNGLISLAMVAGLAACASAGGHSASYPVVDDPAPIVAGTMRPYQIAGRWYRPAEQPDYDETGMASWYGARHNGRPTASGEIFDMTALTAAHKTLPLPGLVEVTNLENGRRAVLRVNDRGPFSEGRIIDLSRAAADELGLLSKGVGQVRVRYIGRAPRRGGGVALASASPARMPPVSTSRPSPVAPAAIWIQAGLYGSRDEAQYIAQRLGQRAVMDQRDGAWRVLLGPWPDANAAEQARQAAIAGGCPDALLISVG